MIQMKMIKRINRQRNNNKTTHKIINIPLVHQLKEAINLLIQEEIIIIMRGVSLMGYKQTKQTQQILKQSITKITILMNSSHNNNIKSIQLFQCKFNLNKQPKLIILNINLNLDIHRKRIFLDNQMDKHNLLFLCMHLEWNIILVHVSTKELKSKLKTTITLLNSTIISVLSYYLLRCMS